MKNSINSQQQPVHHGSYNQRIVKIHFIQAFRMSFHFMQLVSHFANVGLIEYPPNISDHAQLWFHIPHSQTQNNQWKGRYIWHLK